MCDRPSPSEYMDVPKPERCGGGGELVSVLTPMLDHRDPAFTAREYPCPGCPDCTEGRTLADDSTIRSVMRFPNTLLSIMADGVFVCVGS